MNQIADSVNCKRLDGDSDGTIELSIFRTMIAAVFIAVIVSTILAPWRFTAGLMLGGALSLLNYHWLRTSIAGIFNIDVDAQKPQARASLQRDSKPRRQNSRLRPAATTGVL